MALERELVLELVEDHLDAWALTAEAAEARPLVAAVGAQEQPTQGGDEQLDLPAQEPLSPIKM
jgi:hypothetical protein